jgi:hypothetical protein
MGEVVRRLEPCCQNDHVDFSLDAVHVYHGCLGHAVYGAGDELDVSLRAD